MVFQMRIGLRNSQAPRNTYFHKVKKKKAYSSLSLNGTPENKTNSVDKQVLAKSH